MNNVVIRWFDATETVDPERPLTRTVHPENAVPVIPREGEYVKILNQYFRVTTVSYYYNPVNGSWFPTLVDISLVSYRFTPHKRVADPTEEIS